MPQKRAGMDRRKGWLRQLKPGEVVRVTSPDGPTVTTVERVSPSGMIFVAWFGTTMRFHWNGYAHGMWWKLEQIP